MNDCIFCKIIEGKIPSVKIYEDDSMLSFLDINPVNFGHVLIIPKKHYQWMTDVPNDLLEKIFVKSRDLMKAIKKTMKADYVALSVIGTDVPHFHIHLIPRFFNDGLSNFWPTKKYKENEAEKIAKKIRENLKTID
ncbi:HIT family protein [Candidatus Pacearchaeota archaeon]|nr:HIT family protein [Candidatus Pacearchaeota archaeon]